MSTRPEAAAAVGDARVDRGPVAHVDDHARVHDPPALGTGASVSRSSSSMHVARPDVGAALGERDGDGAAEAVRGAGDDGGLAGEVEVHGGRPSAERAAASASSVVERLRTRAALDLVNQLHEARRERRRHAGLGARA